MKCWKCGYTVEENEDVNFCSRCGARLHGQQDDVSKEDTSKEVNDISIDDILQFSKEQLKNAADIAGEQYSKMTEKANKIKDEHEEDIAKFKDSVSNVFKKRTFGKCVNCGEEIKAGSVFCPACGAQQWEENSAKDAENKVSKKPLNAMCVIGPVLAVLAGFFGLGGLGGLIAVCLSIYGLMECKKKDERGRVLAMAGIVIGIFALLIWDTERAFDGMLYGLFSLF